MNTPLTFSWRRYLLYFAIPPLLLLIGIAVFIYGLHRAHLLAPVPLTGSASFDEKLEALRDRQHKPIDVLACGSSMTLQNLNSRVVMEHLPAGMAYYNAGAMGIHIASIRKLVELLEPRFHPKAIIMVTGPMDYYRNFQVTLDPDFSDAAPFIDGEPYALAVFKHFDLFYYTKSAQAKRHPQHGLSYDAYGAMPLELGYPQVDLAYFNRAPSIETEDFTEYEELRKLADYLAAKKVVLFVVQSPLRQTSAPEIQQRLQSHWQRINRALVPAGLELINLHTELSTTDYDFSDYAHLSPTGTQRFTQALMERIEGRLVEALKR